jgi:hypothetical protein
MGLIGFWFPVRPPATVAGQCFSLAFVANTTKQAIQADRRKQLKNMA